MEFSDSNGAGEDLNRLSEPFAVGLRLSHDVRQIQDQCMINLGSRIAD